MDREYVAKDTLIVIRQVLKSEVLLSEAQRYP